MLYEKRKKFEPLDKRVGLFFKKFGLTPNHWTLLSIIFGILSFYSLIHRDLAAASLLLAISGLCDVIDGDVARATGRVTKKGAYYDTMADRYVEFFIVTGLMMVSIPDFFVSSQFWILSYFFGSMITTYAKSAAKEKDIGEIKGGLLERGERLLLLIVGILLGSLNFIYLTYAIVLLAVLTNISALQRIYKALRAA